MLGISYKGNHTLCNILCLASFTQHNVFEVQPCCSMSQCFFIFNVCMLVAQSCLTLWDPMDCTPPGYSVHGIPQTRILAWVAIPFSIRSSWPRDQTWFSHIASRFFMVWAIRELLFLMAEYYSTAQRCYWVQALTACCTTGQQIKKQVVGASNSDFIWKASKLRRWWASVPKNHLPWVKIQVYFDTERGGGVVGSCKLLDVKNPLFSKLSG